MVIVAARRRPYIIENLKFDDFFEIKPLTNDVVINTIQNTVKEKVHWLNKK